MANGPETVSEIHPSSVIDTPFTEYPRHCLYVRDLVLCRKNGEGRYLVDSALTINTTLADTGAGPSVVTTALLESLGERAREDVWGAWSKFALKHVLVHTALHSHCPNPRY
eukprot:scaffold8421_cov114-Isochrysis_galbana.AAC.8